MKLGGRPEWSTATAILVRLEPKTTLPIKRCCVEIESFLRNPACESSYEYMVWNGALVFMVLGLIVKDVVVLVLVANSYALQP